MLPRILIIGLGAYYRKLAEAIWSEFEVALLADTRSTSELRLSPEEASRFVQVPSDLEGIEIFSSVDCVMLLTPPMERIKHLEILARLQVPVLAEKPLLASQQEIPNLLATLDKNPFLYCSDFYPDVRAVPLLLWLRPHQQSCLKSTVSFIEGDPELWYAGPDRFGGLRIIEGKLLESTSDPSGTFSDRDWLWQRSQGGVVRDLMYHYFTLSSHAFDEEIMPNTAIMSSNAGSMDPEFTQNYDYIADTYAYVSGTTSGGVPFHFEVAKYWPTHSDRRYIMQFAHGTAEMIFAKPNCLLLEHGDNLCKIQLIGDYYHHVVRCFKHYVLSGKREPHGLINALKAIRLLDTIYKIAEWREVAYNMFIEPTGSSLKQP